jgi:hypothetical protein
MDEIKTTKNLEFNFSLDLPNTYFGSGKYPKLENEQKTELIRINYLNGQPLYIFYPGTLSFVNLERDKTVQITFKHF